jgi:hypothetical protein
MPQFYKWIIKWKTLGCVSYLSKGTSQYIMLFEEDTMSDLSKEHWLLHKST